MKKSACDPAKGPSNKERAGFSCCVHWNAEKCGLLNKTVALDITEAVKSVNFTCEGPVKTPPSADATRVYKNGQCTEETKKLGDLLQGAKLVRNSDAYTFSVESLPPSGMKLCCTCEYTGQPSQAKGCEVIVSIAAASDGKPGDKPTTTTTPSTGSAWPSPSAHRGLSAAFLVSGTTLLAARV